MTPPTQPAASVLEPAAAEIEPEPPPGAEGAPQEGREALRAALQGIEDALSHRRPPASVSKASASKVAAVMRAVRRSTAGARPQAVPQPRPTPPPPAPRPAPQGPTPTLYERIETRLERTASAAGARLLAGLRTLAGTARQELPLLPARARTAGRAAVAAWTVGRASGPPRPTSGRSAAGRADRKSVRSWFGRRETAAVIYPKRRPGSYSDHSLMDSIGPAVPMLASVAVVALIVSLYPNLLTGLLGVPGTIATPTLAGRNLGEAREAAGEAGLRIEVARVQPSEEVPKDVVIEQDPRPGVRLDPGEAVKLVVSGGLRPPDVTGKTVDQARVELIVHGWKPHPEVETRVANGVAANVVVDQRPRPEEAAPEKGLVTLIVASPNLAAGKPTRMSTGRAAPEATDGVPTTVARPGPAPHWVELELGSPISLVAMSLLPALERPGGGVVEVWGWDSSGQFFPVHSFMGDFTDGTPLSFRLNQPTLNVVRLRIATTSSASPLGWREISVLDR